MFTLSKSWSLLALGTLIAFGGMNLPARADQFTEHLGPVGPHEPILTTVGSKRVIAFYEPSAGLCGMHVVVWDSADASGGSAARVRVSLNPRQMIQIDSSENKSINLQCGNFAESLALIESNSVVSVKNSQ
jgi:hypothetical protein